jgi:hypothetical protein
MFRVFVGVWLFVGWFGIASRLGFGLGMGLRRDISVGGGVGAV